MALILNIDTAVTTASVCLSHGAAIQSSKQNPVQGESAAWLHTAIQQLLAAQKLSFAQLSAIAVSAGPGSYTGLRVGMATAKGLCYAAGLPLILVNTLQMMAAAAGEPPTDLLCPMIDARRMEVFTAIYTKDLEETVPPRAVVLRADTFSHLLEAQTITFFGNGSAKFQSLMQHPHAVFKTITADATHMAGLSAGLFSQQKFASLAYSEPFYGKEFYTPAAISKG